MKRILLIILLGPALCSYGQTNKFKSLNDFSEWTMNYYKNPEPALLLDAFKYGMPQKKIEKAGSRPMILAFFSSSLRNDTVLQKLFVKDLMNTNDEDLIYGLGLTLWYIHSDHSIKLMNEFLGQKRLEKYNIEFNTIKNQRFADIWADPINDPVHLDRLWADFFATGNEYSVKKIMTKLTDLGSSNQYDMVTANAAKWSLTSNSVSHDKVLEICKSEVDAADTSIQVAIKDIIAKAEEERRKEASRR